MAKNHLNTCWICGKTWGSTKETDDCGSTDQKHKEARK